MLVAFKFAVSQNVLWSLMDVSLKHRKTTCLLGPTRGVSAVANSVSSTANANSLTTDRSEKLF